MINVCFVILHYLALNDTIECVESILNNVNYNNYSIVIVDNNSPDSSGKHLKEIYLDNNDIEVILSNENLGFAKGNNLGFIYAKERLNSDFVILINNDTIIEQSNFIDLVIETFNRTHYYVLGPDIVSTKDKCHQNPNLIRLNGLQKKEVKSLIRQIDFLYIKTYLKYITHSQKLITALKNMLGIYCTTIVNQNKYINKELENIQLHGACIILSPLYLEGFDYAFFPETYMYMEEDILYYICKKNNFKTVYNPSIKILHKEDSSTNLIMNSPIKKSLFILKHSRHSARILYNIMNKG